jgi:tripartite-type tricarboxylate transporter receptor subunit TctC
MKLPRRRFLHLAAGAAALPAVTRSAWAQTYPSRPVTLIVFVPAGGTPDIIARLVGHALSQRLGQSVVIDNRPGGGGNLALQAVARAPADGYTLLMLATPHAVNVTLSNARLQVLPDIPPISDVVPGFAVIGWLGVGVPKGTPAEIVERLNQEVNLALADPAVRARMADLGSEPLFGSVSDFTKLIANETEKWAKVVKFAGLKQD